MNTNYLVGTIFNRIIGIVNVISLTYLLSANQFSIFIFAYTAILFGNIILGWWMNAASYKYADFHDAARKVDYFSSLGLAVCCVMAVLALILGAGAVAYAHASWATASWIAV
jgi:O-antigen/teichoic acid export membrane protein